MRHVKGRILRPGLAGRGYPFVQLSVGNCPTLYYVHRAILETFVGPCPEGLEGCHGNDIHTDNRLENLRWDTRHANNDDKKRNERTTAGEAHPGVKLRATDIPVIRRSPLLQRELAKQYGVGQTAISNIKHGKKWRSVPVDETQWRIAA
jgi:hypothetical protein